MKILSKLLPLSAVFGLSILATGCTEALSNLSPSTKLIGTWECESTDFAGRSYEQVYRRNGTYYTSGRFVKKDSIDGKPFNIVYNVESSGDWSLDRNNVLEQTPKVRSFKNVTDVPGFSYQQNLKAREIIDKELGVNDRLNDTQTHFFKLKFESDSQIISQTEGGGNNESCSRAS